MRATLLNPDFAALNPGYGWKVLSAFNLSYALIRAPPYSPTCVTTPGLVWAMTAATAGINGRRMVTSLLDA
jgi:hypothetical protein